MLQKTKSTIRQMRLNPITLSFQGRYQNLEPLFTDQYNRTTADHIRIPLVIGIIAYAAFGLLDVALVPEQKTQLYFIRFAIVCPFIFLGILLSFTKGFHKFVQGYLFILIILAGTGISVMVAITSSPTNQSYYVGIILVLMLGYGLARVRFIWAASAGWINVCIYELMAIWWVDTSAKAFLNVNFFILSANVIGMFTCYSIELYTRKYFFTTHQLNLERKKTIALNQGLERRVKKRTAELKQSNKKLLNEIEAHDQDKKEKEVLESQLTQAHKMEAIGTLAGGIAHDFNNILSSIIGYTELSLCDVEKNSIIEENLQEVFAAGIRAKELVRQILAFARQSDEEMKPVKMDTVVGEVLKLIRSSTPATIEIKNDIQSESKVIGNATQIHQILMNLCTNATHAMEKEGGILNVGLTDIAVNGDKRWERVNLPHGKYIELRVSDTGEGIAPEIIDSIFNPYFTTKGPGEGTGMGLSMVHGIVESYGGRIIVDSSPGEGSAFKIYIPVSEKQSHQTAYKTEILPQGTENILLIDDEATLVRMHGQILRSLGYSVTIRTSSVEALELFRSQPDNFDLVITDMTMPNMTGDALAMELLKLQREIPVIICTGYSKKISEQAAADIGIKAFVHKPIVKADLAKVVRKVLDEGKEQTGPFTQPQPVENRSVLN